MPIDIPAFAYAAAVAGGGILGYVRSSEFMSNVILVNFPIFVHIYQCQLYRVGPCINS